MRIGLLGGTFNPLHNCHLQIAKEIQERFPLDQILFIPSGSPPHKAEKNLPSGRDRLEMTRLALLPHPSFKVLDIEVQRKGPSYSIDTLRLLLPQLKGEVYFILGIDAFLEIESWKEADRLFHLCHFIVVSRPEHPFSSLDYVPFIGPIDLLPLKYVDQGKADRYSLFLPACSSTSPKRTLTFLKIQPCLISATDIRTRIEEGRTVKKLLPKDVQSYIMGKSLYRNKCRRKPRNVKTKGKSG